MSDKHTHTKHVRGKRTSSEQMEILINYITDNKIIITGKTSPNNIKEVDEHWEKITGLLNNVRGANKTVKEWKIFFTEWKSKTRKKAREIKVGFTGTGGGPPKDLKLTKVEERLISLLGKVSIDGSENLPPEIDPLLINNDIDINKLDIIMDVGNIDEVAGIQEKKSPKWGECMRGTLQELPSDIIIASVKNTTEKNTCEPESPWGINQNTRVPTNMNSSGQGQNKKYVRKYISSTTALEKFAEIYAESTKNICNAMIIFAESLNKIANAFEHYAQATEKLAEAQKQ